MFESDILQKINERSDDNRKDMEEQDNTSYTYIYYYIDEDGNEKIAKNDHIIQMLKFLNNETENRKLFIIYSMADAIRHYKDKESFRDLTIKCKKQNCPNSNDCADKSCLKEPHYKTFVPTDSVLKYGNLNST